MAEKSGGQSHFRGGMQGGYQRNDSPIKADSPIKFYKDAEKTKLDPSIFAEHAEKKADEIRGDELNSAQLRRFFGEMKNYYQSWKNQEKKEETFEKILPLIKLMKSKVFYAINPKKPKIPQKFASFLLGGVEQIQDGRDFEAFILYFEAVVGFMYGKGLVSK